MIKPKEWELKSERVFKRYIAALKRDLLPNWTVADVEQAMEKHYQAFMEDTNQALIDEQDFPPCNS